MKDSVVVPEPVTLVGETLQKDVVLVVRLTTPANPLIGLIVMVDCPDAFTLTLALEGAAVFVKS